jgi:hypothetical protein
VSNPQAREPWRRHSVLAPVADGVVAGFGGLGYELAIEAAARLLDGPPAAGPLDTGPLDTRAPDARGPDARLPDE